MRRTRRRPLTFQHPPAHDRWLLSYADFVTLLFALFAVLFATTWRNGRRIQTVSSAIHSGFDSLGATPPATNTVAPPASPPRLKPTPARLTPSELNRQLQAVLGDAIRRQEIVVQQTPDGVVISLRELGFFHSGDARLLPGAAEKLQRTAQVLMQHDLELRVEGHSDDQPIHNPTFRSNWELSTARATSVLSLLVDEAGFNPARISVAGYGPYRPVASNATPEGRSANRRVDLVVLPPSLTQESPRN